MVSLSELVVTTEERVVFHIDLNTGRLISSKDDFSCRQTTGTDTAIEILEGLLESKWG